jgi:hypothetical protein
MDRIIKADLYRHDGLKGVSGFLYAFLFIPVFVSIQKSLETQETLNSMPVLQTTVAKI